MADPSLVALQPRTSLWRELQAVSKCSKLILALSGCLALSKEQE
jgi:hypothetical protein